MILCLMNLLMVSPDCIKLDHLCLILNNQPETDLPCSARSTVNHISIANLTVAPYVRLLLLLEVWWRLLR